MLRNLFSTGLSIFYLIGLNTSGNWKSLFLNWPYLFGEKYSPCDDENSLKNFRHVCEIIQSLAFYACAAFCMWKG